MFICGNNLAYTQLPTDWAGQCILGFLLPDVDIIPGDEPVPISTIDYIAGRVNRAIQFIPLLTGLGLTRAIASGAADLGHSLVQYNKLSTQLISDVQALSETIQDL